MMLAPRPLTFWATDVPFSVNLQWSNTMLGLDAVGTNCPLDVNLVVIPL